MSEYRVYTPEAVEIKLGNEALYPGLNAEATFTYPPTFDPYQRVDLRFSSTTRVYYGPMYLQGNEPTCGPCAKSSDNMYIKS